jgi:hypothetical protein
MRGRPDASESDTAAVNLRPRSPVPPCGDHRSRRINGDNVRRIELGEGFRLTTKSPETLRIVRHLRRQHLPCDVASKLRVVARDTSPMRPYRTMTGFHTGRVLFQGARVRSGSGYNLHTLAQYRRLQVDMIPGKRTVQLTGGRGIFASSCS